MESKLTRHGVVFVSQWLAVTIMRGMRGLVLRLGHLFVFLAVCLCAVHLATANDSETANETISESPLESCRDGTACSTDVTGDAAFQAVSTVTPDTTISAEETEIYRTTDKRDGDTSSTSTPVNTATEAATKPDRQGKHSSPTNYACSCDIIEGACDLNCCCDADCSEMERQVFSGCDTRVRAAPEPSGHCYSASLMYTNNTEFKVVKANGGLMCIIKDNLPLRLKYTSQKVIKSQEKFDKLWTRKRAYSWYGDSRKLTAIKPNAEERIKAGDPIWIYRFSKTDTFTYFAIPASRTSSMCQTQEAVRYLQEKHSSCLLNAPIDKETCENVLTAQGKRYCDITLVSSPKQINFSNIEGSTEAFLKLKTLICNRGICNAMERIPSTQYKGGQCNNVVQKVRYILQHNATEGLVGGECRLELGRVVAGSGQFRVSVGVSFKKVLPEDSSSVFKRSGRPGYVTGYPVISGTRVSTNPDRFSVSSLKEDWISVLSAEADGSCSKLTRRNILFNNNMKVACSLTVLKDLVSTQENCTALYDKVLGDLTALGEGRETKTWVSSWGDPQLEESGAWAPVLGSNGPGPVWDGQCRAVAGTVAVRLVTALTGPTSAPQARILAASFLPSLAPIHCSRAVCRLTLTTSVTFIDTTVPPLPRFADPPMIRITLPPDFFYPFSTNNAIDNKPLCILIIFVFLFVFI